MNNLLTELRRHKVSGSKTSGYDEYVNWVDVLNYYNASIVELSNDSQKDVMEFLDKTMSSDEYTPFGVLDKLFSVLNEPSKVGYEEHIESSTDDLSVGEQLDLLKVFIDKYEKNIGRYL